MFSGVVQRAGDYKGKSIRTNLGLLWFSCSEVCLGSFFYRIMNPSKQKCSISQKKEVVLVLG